MTRNPRRLWVAAAVPLLALGACASHENGATAPAQDRLTGRKLTVIRDSQHAFLFMTGAKIGLNAVLGPLGSMAAAESGKKLLERDDLHDPAWRIATDLSAALKERGVSDVENSDELLDSMANWGDPDLISTKVGGDGLALLVRTYKWELAPHLLNDKTSEDPLTTLVSRYRWSYLADVTLVDVDRAKKLVNLRCGYTSRDPASQAPTYEQVTAPGGELLRGWEGSAAQDCLNRLQAALQRN